MEQFNQTRMYHIDLTPADGAAYAIITGDPGRVEGIARCMERPQFVAFQREYHTWAGEIGGRRVLVTSHGIGGSSTAICVEELWRCGVRTVIRMGTCGGMAQQVLPGDVVVAGAAVRAEGTSQEYLPAVYPAVADWDVTAALREAALAAGKRVHTGVVHCKDSFYGQHDPQSVPVRDALVTGWNAFVEAGCLASEMESAALYALAAVRGIRAGCVLHTVWNQERAAAGHSEPKAEDMSHLPRITVDAVRRLMEAERGNA